MIWLDFDYVDMLKEAMAKIPKKTERNSRFKIPQVVSEIEGQKTIIKNFSEIAEQLRRNPNHLAKYFFKEFAARGTIQNSSLIIQSKVSRDSVQKKLEAYIKEFVYCKTCGEPDTKLEKEDRMIFMKCEACGSRRVVRNV